VTIALPWASTQGPRPISVGRVRAEKEIREDPDTGLRNMVAVDANVPATRYTSRLAGFVVWVADRHDTENAASGHRAVVTWFAAAERTCPKMSMVPWS